MTLAEIQRTISAAIRAARKEGVTDVQVVWHDTPSPDQRAALYRHFDKEGRLLYVGVARDVWKRQSEHRITSHWYEFSARMEVETYPNRYDALMAERDAIRTEKPLYNIVWRTA